MMHENVLVILDLKNKSFIKACIFFFMNEYMIKCKTYK